MGSGHETNEALHRMENGRLSGRLQCDFNYALKEGGREGGRGGWGGREGGRERREEREGREGREDGKLVYQWPMKHNIQTAHLDVQQYDIMVKRK